MIGILGHEVLYLDAIGVLMYFANNTRSSCLLRLIYLSDTDHHPQNDIGIVLSTLCVIYVEPVI